MDTQRVDELMRELERANAQSFAGTATASADAVAADAASGASGAAKLPKEIRRGKWRITLNAPVTLIFVALCTLATIIGVATSGVATTAFFSTYHSSLLNPLTYLRFFTHVIGHSGFDHLIGNMAYILLLGPLLEEKYGSRALAEVIALTAVVTALINYVFFPLQGLCGASGVCFAFILLSSITSIREGEIPLTFILVVVFFLGQQVYLGLFVQDNISNMAHIVGGIVGAVSGFALTRNKRGA